MKIIALSDTHRQHLNVKVPKGDMLIFAGDGEFASKEYFTEFLEWFSYHPHPYKILVAGNHDFYCENNYEQILELCNQYDILYLEDSGANVNGVNIWGSPYTPTFFNWAFMRARGDVISKVWDKIPMDTDILITHGPPYGILDYTSYKQYVGCWDLGYRIEEIKPKYHIFGHIHHSSGVEVINNTTYVNCSVLNDKYIASFKPKVIEYKG